MKLTKRAVFLLFLTCFFSACDTVFCVAYVYFQAQVLTGIEQGSMEIVLRCIALAGGFYLLRMVSWFLTAVNRMGFLANGVTGARDRIMKNVLSRPIRIFRKQDDSYYLNLLGEDAELYRNTWLDSIYGIFSGLISVIFNAGMLFFLHPGLLMVGVITSAIPVFTSRLFTKATQKRRKAVSQTAESFTGVLKEGIEGSEALRSAKGKEPFLSRFHTACEAKADAQSKSALTNNLAFMTLLASGVVAQLACMGVGGYLSVSGLIPLATVYAALRYVTDLSNSLSNTMEDVVNFRASKPLVEKLKSETQVPCPVGGGLTAEEGQELTYENVTFGFGDRVLYEGLSCTFAPGGCYAIVGESGSGKSTLTKLLLKYYDDYQGRITLAGRDIRELNEEEIYRVVGLVSQSPFLFNASLYENITMFTGTPEKDSQAYKQLLADLNLTALAERVGDAPLGDFGDNISGGERQRINIARALRSRPSIFIFDEPTTGLDPENVALIEKFIFEHEGGTRIVITHNWAEDYLSRFDQVFRIGVPAQSEE